MDFYFKRAKKVPVSDGILFETDSTNTGIDGGWRSPHIARNVAIASAALAAGIGVYYLVKKKGRRGQQ